MKGIKFCCYQMDFNKYYIEEIMRLIAVIILLLVGMFFLFEHGGSDVENKDIYNSLIVSPTSRYWDTDIKEELNSLTYEDRALVYEFMKQYHKLYINYYRGPIKLGDAIFYQKLTGNIPIQKSAEISLMDDVREKDSLIASLKSENEYYRREYEAAVRKISSTQTPSSSVQSRITPSRDQVSSANIIDKESVYRKYGVYELEKQLKAAQALDRKDPDWAKYQTDSPHTERIRRLLMEAREAADRSMQ